MYPFAFSISILALGIGIVKSAEILGFTVAILVGFSITIWGVVWLLLDMRSLVKLSPEGRAVLVTGCDTGLGHALVKELDTRGCTVFAICQFENSKGAKFLRNNLSQKCHVIQADITQEEEVSSAFTKVKAISEEENITLWGVVNNAAIDRTGPIEIVPLEMYKEVSDVNLFGTIRVTKTFLPLLRKSKGRIINVSSVKGTVTIPNDTVYTIAKFALEGFSDGLRREMKRFGVDVVVIQPGQFGALTAITLNVESQLRANWQAVDDGIKEAYNKAFIDKLLAEFDNMHEVSARDLSPVNKAFCEALFSKYPKDRYMVPGSSSFIDIAVVASFLSPHLPAFIMDWVLIRLGFR